MADVEEDLLEAATECECDSSTQTKPVTSPMMASTTKQSSKSSTNTKIIYTTRMTDTIITTTTTKISCDKSEYFIPKLSAVYML